MAHKIEWIEEPWLLRVTYIDRMTSEDIEAVMDFCIKTAEKHPLNFLVDLTTVRFQESSVYRSKSLINLLRHRGSRWFAFVGLNGVMAAAANALMTRTPWKSFPKDKDAEAVAFLKTKVEQQKAEAAKAQLTKQAV